MISLNNPGNIRHYGNTKNRVWQGLAQVQNDKNFWRFTTPLMGIRAMVVILRNYPKLHNVSTIAQAIAMWAPPSDNNPTTTYAANVARACGVGINDKVDLSNPALLNLMVNAMIRQENGTNPYPKLLVAQAVDMAAGHA